MNTRQITVIYGNDPYPMTLKLLQELDLAKQIPTGASIALKPNLVVARPASDGATTHPEIAAAIIVYLQEYGFTDLTIMEGSWLGEDTRRAFRNCGYDELARKYHVNLVDLKHDATFKVTAGDIGLTICQKAVKIDFLINLPVLKAHCQTELTCALKNLKGCIPDSEKRRYHSLGLHRPIAALASCIRTGITIVDALAGDLSFEEGGNPIPMDRLIAGSDPVLLDAYAATLIGLNPAEVPYIGYAAALGVGSADPALAEIHEINPEEKPGLHMALSGQARSLGEHIEQRQACSACYGSLIHALYRLDIHTKRLQNFSQIKIGQGFRGQTGPGPGIGSCTKGLREHLPGCPPTAKTIADFLSQFYQ